jgi:hypothetical protein
LSCVKVATQNDLKSLNELTDSFKKLYDCAPELFTSGELELKPISEWEEFLPKLPKNMTTLQEARKVLEDMNEVFLKLYTSHKLSIKLTKS